MTLGALAALASSWVSAPMLLAMLALAPNSASEPTAEVRSITIRNEVIWRVPVAPRRAPALEWIEDKGPRCIPASAISGAMLSGAGTIDFALRRRGRVRAVLANDCPAIDFYGGFYVQPADEMICARRDDIRSRMGGSCRIDKFRRLTLSPKAERE